MTTRRALRRRRPSRLQISRRFYGPSKAKPKRDLVDYYVAISKWILPYLKSRPVMTVGYPTGIDGNSFYQKDAPGFAPDWIRTQRIYSEDSKREISYFVIESAQALAYLANLGTIPIHIWSSRIGSRTSRLAFVRYRSQGLGDRQGDPGGAREVLPAASPNRASAVPKDFRSNGN
ncbi:MAG TPA: hypothetical protein VGI47_04620 [Candidatus Binataceae bacterium]